MKIRKNKGKLENTKNQKTLKIRKKEIPNTKIQKKN